MHLKYVSYLEALPFLTLNQIRNEMWIAKIYDNNFIEPFLEIPINDTII